MDDTNPSASKVNKASLFMFDLLFYEFGSGPRVIVPALLFYVGFHVNPFVKQNNAVSSR